MCFNLKLTCFPIALRGPTIWSKLLMESEKSYTIIAVFKNKIKENILNFSNHNHKRYTA